MFGFHPVNLAFRFILEIAALVAIAAGGYQLADGPTRWLAAIGLPLLAAVAWGLFNVPGDRSRSGKAPVPVPGRARLVVEAIYFGSAVALLLPRSRGLAVGLGIAVIAHYSLSLDRIRWLLESGTNHRADTSNP